MMMTRLIFVFVLLFFCRGGALGYFSAIKNHTTAKHINLLRLYHKAKLDKIKEKRKKKLFQISFTMLKEDNFTNTL